MGWTGQPTIVEREDRTWAIFGGYDGHIHFMDVDTGAADPPRRRDRRHHQGHAHDRPRGLPARVLRVARQPPAGHRARPARRRPRCSGARQRVAVQPVHLERRLGLLADHHRRLHDRRQREQPLLGGQAQPLLRRGRPRASGPRGRVHRRGVGRAGDRRQRRRRARLGRELGDRRRRRRLLRHLGWARAGLRPVRSRRGRDARAGVPLLHRGRQRRVGGRRRGGLPLRRRAERPTVAPDHPSRRPAAEARSARSRRTRSCGPSRRRRWPSRASTARRRCWTTS